MADPSAFSCFVSRILSWQLYYFNILEYLHKRFIVFLSFMHIFRIKISFHRVLLKLIAFPKTELANNL